MVRALLNGLVLGLSVVIPFGPVNLVVFRTAVSGGAARAFAVGLGAATMDALYLGAALFGAASLRIPPAVRAGLCLAGSIFLTRLAIGMFRSAPVRGAGSAGCETAAPHRPIFGEYAAGIAVTALNPVTFLFWGAVGSALAGSGAPRPVLSVTYCGVLSGVVGWFAVASNLYAFAAKRLRPGGSRVVNVACGAVLLFYAARFLREALLALRT
ncbi:MAG: LysE family translocator [Firmicutes bacterium]|jgi:threonine/homoserine/homoserine lactone efflux protein|nr:LysE family translocator [Bacillota bacterium]